MLVTALLVTVLGANASLPMPPPPAAAKPKLLRLVQLDPVVVGDVPDRALAAFQQALPAELRKLEAVSVLSSKEIREILSVERQKQVLGCVSGESCMEELAGALDVSESLGCELSLVGSRYTLTLRRINLLHAQVQAKTRTFEKHDGEELLAVVGPMIQELYPDRPLQPGKTRGVSAEVVRRLNPPPVPRWVFFTTAGAAVAAGVGGGIFGFLSSQSSTRYEALAQQSVTAQVSGADLASLGAQATQQAQTANVLFVTAGALAVGAGIEAVFTDWSDERAQPAVALVPGPHGAIAVFAGTF